jgi:type I restriction enzyme S subunit
MVPSGWEVAPLIKATKWSSGGTPSKSNPSFWGGETPWISAASMRGHYYSDSELKITDLAVSKAAKIANKGSILLLVRGSMLWNKIPIGITTRRVSFNQDVKCIVPDSRKLSVEFLLCWFLANENRLMGMVTGTGIGAGKLDTNDLQSLDLVRPPLSEQRKIAKTLSTWDKAISTTERLIDNSKQQKKALMQQLLTGKKRLLDESGEPFEGEWEDKHLHDVAKIIVSPVDKKTIEGEIPVELCNYTDVYYNIRITNTLAFMKATAKQSEIDKYTLQVGDVIITKDSETPGDIAVPALVSEDLNGVLCGYHLTIVRPNEDQIHGAFLNYLFSMQKTRYYFFTLATGATRFGLSVGAINKAHFRLPSIKEQVKIAIALTSADKEIELLEQQLSDLKLEKKGLMQQLLTGKRRVKTEEMEVV